eukprot:scaffold6961_cov42-Phaeocystis_antarctica.AAC.2
MATGRRPSSAPTPFAEWADPFCALFWPLLRQKRPGQGNLFRARTGARTGARSGTRRPFCAR